LTAGVERLPAALFGLVAILFITLAAWRLSRSRGMTLFVLALAALTPWLTQESRVGFEVISMVALLCVAVWCLAASAHLPPHRFAIAGCCLALSVLAYSTGRLEVLLFAVAFAVCYRHVRRWWVTLLPIGAAYILLGAWSLLHPGALTAEFNLISIAADGASFPVLAGRFIGNYIQYFSPDFLFVHGDPNLRHNTGYAGMLLAVMAPLLLAGLWMCWQRRREPLTQFVVACLVLGPVAGALTYPAPHALRGAVMLPFLFLLATYGLMAAGAVLRVRAYMPLAAAALAVQGSLYTLDLFTAYPSRAAEAFDVGAVPAVTSAARSSAGHTVFVSTTIDEQPYIDALVALLPPPPVAPADDIAARELQAIGVSVADPAVAEQAAGPGDVLVLAAGDPAPSNATLVDMERAPVNPLGPMVAGRPLVLVYVVPQRA
jgi:hypothetical protein